MAHDGRAREPGRVCPLVRVRVCERHVPSAEPVERAEREQRVLDGVSTLDAHQYGDLALTLGPANVRCRAREQELRGMTLDLPIRDVDEIDRSPQRASA